MGGYIPWYGKKRALLRERERELMVLIEGRGGEAAVARAVEGVRDAQVRALRAKRAELAPAERSAVAVANIDGEIAYWRGLSVGEMVEGYRTGRFGGHRSGAVRKASRWRRG